MSSNPRTTFSLTTRATKFTGCDPFAVSREDQISQCLPDDAAFEDRKSPRPVHTSLRTPSLYEYMVSIQVRITIATRIKAILVEEFSRNRSATVLVIFQHPLVEQRSCIVDRNIQTDHQIPSHCSSPPLLKSHHMTTHSSPSYGSEWRVRSIGVHYKPSTLDYLLDTDTLAVSHTCAHDCSMLGNRASECLSTLGKNPGGRVMTWLRRGGVSRSFRVGTIS